MLSSTICPWHHGRVQSQLYYFSLFYSFLLLLLFKVNCIPCADALRYLYTDLTVRNLSFLFLFFFRFLINKEFKHYAAFSIKCQESSSEVEEGKSKGANPWPSLTNTLFLWFRIGFKADGRKGSETPKCKPFSCKRWEVVYGSICHCLGSYISVCFQTEVRDQSKYLDHSFFLQMPKFMFTSELFRRPDQWEPYQGFADTFFLGWASTTVTTSVPAAVYRPDLTLSLTNPTNRSIWRSRKDKMGPL